jgi:hypothetical protein
LGTAYETWRKFKMNASNWKNRMLATVYILDNEVVLKLKIH